MIKIGMCLVLALLSSCATSKIDSDLKRTKKKTEKILSQIKENGNKYAELDSSKTVLRDATAKLNSLKLGDSNTDAAERVESSSKEAIEKSDSDSQVEVNVESDKTKRDSTQVEAEILTIESVLEALDTINSNKSNQKYTLNPDSVFFGFSTGATFAFVDGLDNASLFLDLTANIGQVLHERFNAEFGVLSGRFSPNETQSNQSKSAVLRIVSNPNSTFTSTTLSGVEKIDQIDEKKFTRAFATVNYRIGYNRSFQANSKLYFATSVNYNRIVFNNTVTSDFQPIDTITSTSNGVRRSFEGTINLRDTLTAQIIQDRSSLFVGLKLYKETANFEFIINGLVGHTWINQVTSNLNSTSGDPTLGRTPLNVNISSRNRYTYLFQGSVLEKKIIGAKIGFEISDLLDETNEPPEYFFYISKQFSLQEFFKLFTPSSG